jgi:signal transduction histidine kinase
MGKVRSEGAAVGTTLPGHGGAGETEPARTVAGGDLRPGPGILRRLNRQLKGLSLLSQFMAAATLVVIVLMFALGYWVNQRVSRSILESAGEYRAIYIRELLTPYLQSMTPQGRMPPWEHQALDDLLGSQRIHPSLISVKIWNREHRIIYSDVKSLIGSVDPDNQIDAAFAGRTVSEFAGGDHHTQLIDGSAEPEPSAVIETYTPLFDLQTDRIVAVGEFYEDASSLDGLIEDLQRSTWLIVAAIAIPMLGLLGLIVHRGSRRIDAQDDLLRRRLSQARRLAQQNARLRKTADLSRIEATRSIETMLSRIGSDIHDGPVQMLSLVIMKLSAREMIAASPSALASFDGDVQRLASSVVKELRDISTGLSLPELEGLTLPSVIQAAIGRHESITGTTVVTSLAISSQPVSMPLKICVFRIVQEALRNSAKHAAGAGQHVHASSDDQSITIEISDEGPGFGEAGGSGRDQAEDGSQPLGLRGMRSRVQAFGGEIRFGSKPGGRGATVRVTLPYA